MLNKIAVTLLCPLLKTIFSPGFLDVWYVTPVKGKDQAPISTTTKKLIDDVHGPKEWQAESWKKTFWFVSQVQFLPSRFGLSDVRTGLSVYLYDSKHLPDMKTQRLEWVSPSLFRLIADLTTNCLRHVISLEFQVSVQKIYKNSANLVVFSGKT